MLGLSIAALICYTFNFCLAVGRMAVVLVPILPRPVGLCTAVRIYFYIQLRLQTCSFKGKLRQENM